MTIVDRWFSIICLLTAISVYFIEGQGAVNIVVFDMICDVIRCTEVNELGQMIVPWDLSNAAWILKIGPVVFRNIGAKFPPLRRAAPANSPTGRGLRPGARDTSSEDTSEIILKKLDIMS